MCITESYLQSFAAWLHREERAAATVDKYSRELAAFAAFLAGREASPELARQYKEDLTLRRTPAGVNGAVAAINAFFTWAGHADWRLKALKIQPRAFREAGRQLTRAEYGRLLSAADRRGDRRLRLVLEALCATGVRVSELRFFTVEAARRGWALVRNKGKTRTVFLPGKLQQRLLDYARARGIRTGAILVTRSGRPMDRSNIWRAMKALCRLAGVAADKVFPHNLRHLFARTFYSVEKDIVRLADILGHSSIDTTRRYTLETDRDCRRRLERLELVL